VFVAVMTLALGIASNTVVFSVVNASLLRPLPYPESDRLMLVHLLVEHGQSSDDVPAGSFFFLRDTARSFENLAVSYPLNVGINMAGAGKPRYIQGLRVSREFFPTLGISPQEGRAFRQDEDRPGSQNCVILSYDLWTRDFRKDPAVVGREIRLDDQTYTVVGVMPRGFRSLPEADLWLPLKLSPESATSGNNYQVIVRLRSGVSAADAQRELDSLSERNRMTALHQPSPGNIRLILQRLQDFESGEVRPSLMMLSGAVIGVLLIACLNLAVLLLVRGSARSHEIGIRIALGSSRRRLVQVLMLESGILAFGGGLLGIILAKEMLPLVLSLTPSDLPLNGAIGIDQRVILFSTCLTMLTPFIFGLVPAVKAIHFGTEDMIGRATRGTTASQAQARLGNLLITVQTALAVILLSTAVLHLQTLVSLQSQSMGFDPQNLLVAQVSLTAQRYETAAATSRLMNEIAEQLHDDPEVEAVAGVSGLPLGKALNLPAFPDNARDMTVFATQYWIISDDYFQVMRIRLVAGTTFSRADSAGAAPVAIVSENLARRWWPQSSALGHFITAGQQLGPQFADTPRQIIGVVADTRTAGAHRPPPPAIFIPAAEAPDSIVAFANKEFLVSIIVRSRGKATLEERVRHASDKADPNLPLVDVHPFAQIARTSLARPRFYASLAGTFGSFALLLTGIGLYGLLRYRIRLRTREIAVRIALGSTPSKVIVMVVQQGLRLVTAGLIIGLIGAYYVRQLFGVTPYNQTKPAVILCAVLLLAVVAALASFLTAFQAAAIEPTAVLRDQ
jgi:predicted permease